MPAVPEEVQEDLLRHCLILGACAGQTLHLVEEQVAECHQVLEQVAERHQVLDVEVLAVVVLELVLEELRSVSSIFHPRRE